mgnify:CR=1 FL=1
MDDTTSVAAQELKQFVERFESEKKDIADAQKEVMAETKRRDDTTQALRKIIAEMYESALGM